MKKGQVENGKEKAKKIKNKKQKENRKRKRKVGSRKIEVGAKGALMKSYRKRKAEVCSVRKDKAGGNLLAGQAGRKVIG